MTKELIHIVDSYLSLGENDPTGSVTATFIVTCISISLFGIILSLIVVFLRLIMVKAVKLFENIFYGDR